MFDKRNDEHNQEEFELTDEDNAQEPDLEAVEENSQQKLKTLRAKLQTCEQEKMQHLEDVQRLKADFLNSKRRLDDEKKNTEARLIDKHIESLLPLCDSFASAMKSEAWQQIDPTWRSGVEGIYNQLQAIMKQYGVTTLEPVGEQFDPQLHEAVGTQAATDAQAANEVVDVVQQGYVRSVGDETRLIRPARVLVTEAE